MKRTRGDKTWSASYGINLTELMKKSCPFEVVGGNRKSRVLAQKIVDYTWMNPTVSSILALRSLTNYRGPLTEREKTDLEREFGRTSK